LASLLPDIDELKITSALVEQVRASTAKSKLQMSRISSLGTHFPTSVLAQTKVLAFTSTKVQILTLQLSRISSPALESIQQMRDGVLTRQELQRQHSAFEKSKSEQRKSESEWELLRADYDARARTLKKDNADLSARLADAESEVSLVKNRVSDVLLAAEQARAEATSLRKQKDAVRQELSLSVNALHALHAAIRNQLPSHEGVGMVIRFRSQHAHTHTHDMAYADVCIRMRVTHR
jgi:chromosome segregation ATPase